MAGLAWRDGASGFLEVDGNRIEYGMWGPAPGTGKAGSPDAAPTIVLLHEGLDASRSGATFRNSSPGRPAAVSSLSRAPDMVSPIRSRCHGRLIT